MLLLILFAFLAGIVTILSPCILPILPIVLTGSVSTGKRRPLGIVLGFILSFTFFTLFLAAIVKATGLPADALRGISITILLIFGLSMLIPQVQVWLERLFSVLSGKLGSSEKREGFWGGVVVGLSLGLVWTPCVGPIIASVITLAATSNVSFAAFFITLAYSLGTAIPMFAVMIGGRGLLQKVPWLLPNTDRIQKVFGVLMILTALSLFFSLDRKFQTFILDTFPQYGLGLTKIEDNSFVQDQLKKMQTGDIDSTKLGRPISEMDNRDGLKAPELIPGGTFFNLPDGKQSLTIKELRGNVVLVDFWTYTCINCIRTLPYLTDWDRKYRDKGLVIIGVHTPEFAFEREADNVKKALKDFGIHYPVMQDNEYATWTAYDNHYWPAKYLIDSKGAIRYTHFGEGQYAETEKIIQDLLKEAGQTISVGITKDTKQIFAEISPETYLGADRMEYLAGEGRAPLGDHPFSLIPSIPVNSFTFGGNWTIAEQNAIAGKNAVLEYHFSAAKVFLVMRPGNTAGTVKVFVDGKIIPAGMNGKDVTAGVITVDTDRLYELVTLPKVENHLLRLEFQTQGTQAYAFTFGS